MNSQTEKLQLQGAAGAIEVLRDAPPTARAARRGRHRPSASAVRRHHGQQGGADAGARLRAVRLDGGALQLPRRRRQRGRARRRPRRDARTCWPWSSRWRPTGRWRSPAFRSAPSSPASALDSALGRARRPRRWCWSARPRRASRSPTLPPEAHERTLVVHGEQDDTVPLAAVMDWARPQSLPVTVVPGGGHFFHGQLPLLKNLVVRHLRAG